MTLQSLNAVKMSALVVRVLTHGESRCMMGELLLMSVSSVSDRRIRVCDLHEHRAQPEDHGRRFVLHPHGRYQRLRGGHGHLHLPGEKLTLRLKHEHKHNNRLNMLVG